jgi:hypothetical protein
MDVSTTQMQIRKKSSLLAGIAALLLATGAAHAQDEDKGTEYNCGPSYDSVWIKGKGTTHEWTWVITIESQNYHTRKGKPYPRVQYDAQKDILRLNGKRCYVRN